MILDTSAVIGLLELPVDQALIVQAIKADDGGERPAVSVVTLGELAAGVQSASTRAARDDRHRSLAVVAGERGAHRFDVLSIARSVWGAFGAISRPLTRKVGHNDKWIAATALATERTLITQDRWLAEAAGAVQGLRVVLVPRQ